MKKLELDTLRIELSVKAKNGIDFIIAASIIWISIAFIWTLPYTSYSKSVFTFMIGGLLLPMAFMFSKMFKTDWKVKDNPLQPLGLWFNFAQLFYFPFLIFTLIKYPDYFVMAYAIITSAHFFPYAWFYMEKSYAVMAGLISLGALIMGLNLSSEYTYLIPALMSICLITLAVIIFISYRKKEFNYQQ
ncbi:hypothetical protein [Fulvivirga sp.]|uniref:DUF7010 family protein n=1 Tax=Fulvivirga sp. TaxID=1931237 RepID=UPI0032EBB166